MLQSKPSVAPRAPRTLRSESESESMGRIARAFERLRASSLGPLVARAVGFAVALVGLVALGAGRFDRILAPPAHAGSSRIAPSALASAIPSEPASALASAIPSEPASAAPGPASSARAGSAPSESARGLLPDGRIALNVATADDLDRLPGIGRKKAEAIVALRERLGGRFRRIEDLARVRGIKRKQLERLRPLVVLDP
jgi:competence protein ComEA